MHQHRPSGAATAGYVITTALLVLVVAFGVFKLVSAVLVIARDDALETDAFLSPDAVSLPEGVSFREWPQVTLELDAPTTTQVLLDLATGVGPFLLFVAAFWLLRGLAASVRAGNAFGTENVKRLRRLGTLLVLGAPVVEFVNSSLRSGLYDTLPAGRFGEIGSGGLNLSTGPLLAGLGAFILAEVFAHGVHLREDVEATV